MSDDMLTVRLPKPWQNNSIEQTNAMFSSLPQSVVDESREAWEAKRMQEEDADATFAVTLEAGKDNSDSEASCLSEADSITSRRHKLSKLACNTKQVEHLRTVKRQAQKRLHNVHCRGQVGNAKHLQGLVGDISATLIQCTKQTRSCNGKFGTASTHQK
jgi:hypothetical protein